MCEIIFGQNIWSVTGLFLDFFGVALLGFDLIRIQKLLKNAAQGNINSLEDMSSQYGGIESWAENIKKGARWIDSSEYSDYHAEDPVSYNANRSIERVKGLADCVEGLSQHLSSLMLLVSDQAKSNLKTANNSVIVSIIGLFLIALGFSMQIIGAWPC